MLELRYQDRTDSIATKLRLLQDAHAAGNLDLAMSLAATIKLAGEVQQLIERFDRRRESDDE